MDEHDWLAKRIETYRAHLRAVAYRMLRSVSEAGDAFLAASRDGDFDALLAVLDQTSCCAPIPQRCRKAR